MTGLCLTLAEASPATLEEKIARYNDQVELIEVRIDHLETARLPTLPSAGNTQFIATCRPQRQGGRYRGEERERLQLIARAAHSDFSWVDLEYDVQEHPPLPSSVQVIRSDHLFDGFNRNPDFYLGRLEEAGGDVLKLAVMVRHTRDLVALLGWMESKAASHPRVIIGMGDLGQPSRLLGGFLGNSWTYVAEQEEQSVAAGQFNLEKALHSYRLTHWSQTPPIYGVMGNPVAHSLSPLLHNELFAHYGLDKVYFPFHLDTLDDWMDYVNQSQLPFQGFSVTLPFKTQAPQWTRSDKGSARALNTLTRKGNGWQGTNTDHQGFLAPLRPHLGSGHKTALVLGNGGVAHTVVEALLQEGLEVTVVGRNLDRVSAFAATHGCRRALFSALPLAADICVNTTPVGQFPDPESSPLPEDQLEFGLVYDLIYHPERTRLLDLAERKGLPDH